MSANLNVTNAATVPQTVPAHLQRGFPLFSPSSRDAEAILETPVSDLRGFRGVTQFVVLSLESSL